MPDWGAIVAKAGKYKYLDGNGGLQVFGRKGLFAWKIEPDCTIQELLGGEFWVYYDEIGKDSQMREQAEEYCERFVQPHFRAIRQQINTLIRWSESASKKQVKNDLEKILKELDGIAPRLKEALIVEKFQPMLAGVGKKLMGQLGPEKARTRLKVRLYNVLRQDTSLTVEDAIKHVVRLLSHFEIEKIPEDTDKEEGAIEATRRTLKGQRREKQEKEILNAQKTQRLWRIKEFQDDKQSLKAPRKKGG